MPQVAERVSTVVVVSNYYYYLREHTRFISQMDRRSDADADENSENGAGAGGGMAVPASTVKVP